MIVRRQLRANKRGCYPVLLLSQTLPGVVATAGVTRCCCYRGRYPVLFLARALPAVVTTAGVTRCYCYRGRYRLLLLPRVLPAVVVTAQIMYRRAGFLSRGPKHPEYLKNTAKHGETRRNKKKSIKTLPTRGLEPCCRKTRLK